MTPYILTKHQTRLKSILENFVQTVRINVSLVDKAGKSILTPEPNHFGWQFLADTADIGKSFKRADNYLEHTDGLGFKHFAIPTAMGYIVVGPLALNKRPERSGFASEELDEVRVISQNHLRSILDLVSGVAGLLEDMLGIEQKKVPQKKASKSPEDLSDIFNSMLDVALQFSHAQSGSIMLFDGKTKELSVQASKGLKNGHANHKPIKLGEGISGLALKERKTLILTDDHSPDNRISHLLKRKEIKQSIIMPFEDPSKKIRGVINVNIENAANFLTKSEASEMARNLEEITEQTLQVI